MSATDEDEVQEFRYRVESVEEVDAPEGMADDVWHRYVIVRGKSIIDGMKPGSRFDVMQHAETVVEGLNERFAKGSTAYVSSKKK